MGLFKVDGPVYEFFRRFIDVLKLNLLWYIFSLPIVTIGASTVAVYSVTLKMAEDREGYIGRDFVKAFKANLRQGIPLGLITLAAIYVVYLNFSLFYAIESNPLPLLIIGILAGVYFLLSLLYAYPLSARYQNTLRNTLNNSFQISIKYIGRTLFLLFIIAFVIVFCLYNTTTIFFGILIGPTFIMFTVSVFSLRIFKQIEKDL
ncbi:MAG TPA: YesL family protein [Clostridiales bacterium]|jgi:uncharacterized membrane protein YesL|nr:YesL family protein [Clostridiales bacterium]